MTGIDFTVAASSKPPLRSQVSHARPTLLFPKYTALHLILSQRDIEWPSTSRHLFSDLSVTERGFVLTATTTSPPKLGTSLDPYLGYGS